MFKYLNRGIPTLIAIGIIVILVIIVGGGVLAWQYSMVFREAVVDEELERPETLPEEEVKMADWKTYRNEDFGFEVKYSENFIKIDERENSVFFSGTEFGFTIGISDLIDHHCSPYPNLVKKEEFKGKDIFFDKVTSRGRMAEATLAYMVQYYVIKEDKCFYFEFVTEFGPDSWYSIEKFPEVLLPYEIFDKIVSTFKFIEKPF